MQLLPVLPLLLVKHWQRALGHMRLLENNQEKFSHVSSLMNGEPEWEASAPLPQNNTSHSPQWNLKCFKNVFASLKSPKIVSDKAAVVVLNNAKLSRRLLGVTLFVWPSEEEFSTPCIPRRAQLNSCLVLEAQVEVGQCSLCFCDRKKQKQTFIHLHWDLNPHWVSFILQSLSVFDSRRPRRCADLSLWA